MRKHNFMTLEIQYKNIWSYVPSNVCAKQTKITNNNDAICLCKNFHE